MSGHVDAHQMIGLVVADLVRELLPYLSLPGLLHLRGRLAAPSEMPPGPVLDLLKLDVDATLAAAMGIDPGLLPDRAPLPDTPGQIPPSSRW